MCGSELLEQFGVARSGRLKSQSLFKKQKNRTNYETYESFGDEGTAVELCTRFRIHNGEEESKIKCSNGPRDFPAV